MKSLVLSCVGALLLSTTVFAGSALQKVPLKDIDGNDTNLGKFDGDVLLVVNVASECGLTPQYKGLQALHETYKEEGFAVLGFPCNQFGGQEPGSNKEIKEFCSTKYKVTFPMFDKLKVKGKGQHPLYKELSGKGSKFPGDVKWNFGKFLVGRDGEVLARFSPRAKPQSDEVVKAVEKALAAKKK